MSKKTQNLNNDELDMSLEEMALEIVDMLGVALHFAGAKKDSIAELTELYAKQMDIYFENLPLDSAYGQKEMIGIIEQLKKAYPQMFKSN